MSSLDPHEAFQDTISAVKEGLHSAFPIKGHTHTLRLREVLFGEMPDPEDVARQQDTKMSGGTWSTPVRGVVELVENGTDKVVRTQRLKLMDLPTTTKRHSFVYKGQEHQVSHQWQLKPGVYARRQANGELESRFNVVNRAAFKLKLDPQSQAFTMEYKKANLPAYPILKAMGVSDAEMQQAWGKEVFQANQKSKRQAGTLAQFYRTSTNGTSAPEDEAALVEHLRNVMSQSKVRPEVVQETMGHATDHVDGRLMLNAASKLIAVQNGAPEDNRDSLSYKTLRSTGDFLKDQIVGTGRALQMKVQRQLNKGEPEDIRKVLSAGAFNESVRKLFQSSLVNPARQINPLDMIGTATQTTIMGPGGIKSDIQVTDAAKMIDRSQFGMIDPITTPEGKTTGISLRLPIGVKRIGDQPHIPVYSLKEKKTVYVNPAEMLRSKIVMADQVKFEHGVPHPIADEVDAMGIHNEPTRIKFHEADYVLKDPSQVYGFTVNLIPFLQNTSGGRASMASRHMEQAISLVDRDKPLVQVKGPGGVSTFEDMIGRQSAHTSPISGTVTEVKANHITVVGEGGVTKKIPLYNHYPLNDSKSVLHSTPLVKVGDKVTEGSLVADNNFTRDGMLALGKNLRTAYMSYNGLNFEDGVVITESAAKKLTSLHLHKNSLYMPEGHTLSFDPNKFRAAHPLLFTKDQYQHIGGDGIARVGSKVKPGDPLIVAMQPFQLKDRTGIAAIRKSLANQQVDKSVRWEGSVEGEVVAVHRSDDKIHVHVKSLEPMQVGDKLSHRSGGKGIVTCYDPSTEVLSNRGWIRIQEVTLADQICTLNPDTREIEYHPPTGLVGHHHTGKMYEVLSTRINLLVTPEHRLFTRASRKGSNYTLEEAQSVGFRGRAHLKVGTWVGKELASVRIPGMARPKGTRRPKKWSEPRNYPADDFLTFFGYWVTEGCLSDSKVLIAQRKEKNPHIYAKIVKAVEALGYTPWTYPDVIGFSDPRLAAWLRQFGKAREKFIPQEFMACSRRQIDLLVEALFEGDGGVYYFPDRNYTRREIYTSSSRLADNYQELALKSGVSATVRSVKRPRRGSVEYVVRWSPHPEVFTKKDPRHHTFREGWVDYDGMVYCVEVPNHVIYVRRGGVPVWSGNCIIPDKDAPHDKSGKPVEVLFQPGGLGGRMNIGQVLEAMGGKIAQKTGKPYQIKNFDSGVKDWTEHMKQELHKHGISDTEELFDPKTKLSYGQVMTGPIQFMKLVHQVDKKESSRGGMALPKLPNAERYDPTTLQPGSGGGTGGQSWGQLGIYALLAHGAKGILRESMTYKSEGDDPETNEAKRWKGQHLQVWTAIQTGQPLPPPKPTFAFHRFTELIKGAGIDVEKRGDQFVLSPLTSKHIKSMSKGEVTDPTAVVHAKRDENGVFKPIKGGLFDEKITGGHGGVGWSHVTLAEPIPHPVFEEPIKKILGITEGTFADLVEGKKAVHPLTRAITEPGKGMLTGGKAFHTLLSGIDVDKELAKTKKALENAKPSLVAPLYKKARYLQGLKAANLKPEDAYVLDSIPIIPPKLRPLSNLDDGSLHYEGINGLYNKMGQLNKQLKDPTIKLLPDSALAPHRAALYEQVAQIFGTVALPEGAKDKGLLHTIAGTSPKLGLAQKGLLSRRQDVSGRATIIPEPKLGLDEIGIPKQMALTLYSAPMVRQLVTQGAAKDPLSAQQLLSEAIKGKHDPQVDSALHNLLNDQLIVAKRDPALWKYSVQAFRPKVSEGKAIRIHPLVTGGFNADFDGDTCLGLVYVEVSTESWNKEEMPHIGSLPVHGLINLRDFPRQQLLRDDGRVAVYSVPDGVVVPSHLNGIGIVKMPVTEFSIHRDCSLWRVVSRSGRLLEVSEDHSLATLDMNTLDVVETKASGSEGKIFPVMRSFAYAHGKTAWGTSCFEGVSHNAYAFPEFPLTKASGWFLGAMVGDGWVSDTSKSRNGTSLQVNLAYGERGVLVADRWGAFLRSLVPDISKSSYRNEHEFEGKPALSFRDTVTHSALGRLLQEQLGHGARNKHLPLDFLEWNEEARRGLLAGLLDTDGSVTWVHAATKNKPQFQAAYHTTSAQLAIEVVLLCQSLGIVANYTEYAKRDGLAYNIFLSTSTMQEATWLDLAHPEKKEALERLWASEPVISGRGDWVPMPPRVREILLTELRKKGAARKEKTEEGKRAFSLYVTLKKEDAVVTRETFRLLEDFLGDAVCGEGVMSAWYALCTNTTLSWDVVETAEATGELHEMYDLTVPGSFTFTMANGAVVWDTMSLFPVLSEEARRDAARMVPSKNIFSESTGGVAYLPSMESLLGIHRLSLVGKSTSHAFTTPQQAMEALGSKKIELNDRVKLNGKETTVGRILLATAVPQELRPKLLHDFSLELNKKGVNNLFTQVGKEHNALFPKVADSLKDLGYATSTGIIPTTLHPKGAVSVGAHTFTLNDFLADKESRDPIYAKADKEVAALQKKGLTKAELDRQTAEAYLRADAEVQKVHKASGKMEVNNLGKMTRAGMKPSADQYKQMTLAPGVMTNTKGDLVPTPVRRSYGEGLNLLGYTVQQDGARSGTVKKVQEVQEPGYMTKLLQNTSMATLIDTHDCGTHRGITMPVDGSDLVDRHLAKPLKVAGLDLPSGTLLSKDVVDRIRKVDPHAQLQVRSPIHCHSEKGICQKCYGLDANGKHPELGTNVGVLSAHALGERAVQLTLKAFHCLHEHSLVLVRHKGRVYHTTLRAVFEGSPGTEPEVRIPQDLEVWGPEGWVRVLSASRHLQEPGTQMVFARTRSGFGLLSQDNHPHMLAENLAVCERCGTYPKRSNGGKQHYCRRCGRTWQGELPEPEDFQMVMPSELSEKSHTAKVSWGPSPTEQEPPLRSGWLAGMFCAEGYVHAQNREQGSYVIGFGISQNQGTPVYNKLGSCLAQEFPEARLGARPRAFQVYGRERGLFFEKTFGRYSRNKGLPEGWSGLPVAWLADFVSGVFDGDGTLVSTKDSAWKVGRIDTTSYLLAQQLHHILRSRGVHSRVLLSPWRKASLHQGFAVTFPITAEAKELLSASLKLVDVEARPHGNEERFGEVVDYVRPVRFGAPPWVYDLETETSTLCVNNVWTHNSGGVATAGGGALGAFARLEQLTYLPDQIPNAATHATVGGKIEKIEKTSTGTNIWVDGRAHFVGKDDHGNSLHEKQDSIFHKKPWNPPQVGMTVRPGDLLSDPNRTHLNPHRLFEATKSIDRVQEALADEMHGLYKDEGVRKRAIETVVRNMGNLTQIEHPGGAPDFLRGQTYARSAIEEENQRLKEAGRPLIKHKPILRGVNLLPLEVTTDWMARLNHQKLRSTLMEGAAQGWSSDLHGRHPVPGLMYGAEFGAPSQDPKKRGVRTFY